MLRLLLLLLGLLLLLLLLLLRLLLRLLVGKPTPASPAANEQCCCPHMPATLRQPGCSCASAAADGVVATSETVNGKLQQRQEEVEELNAVSWRASACGWSAASRCRAKACQWLRHGKDVPGPACCCPVTSSAAAASHVLPAVQVRALLAKLQAVFDLPRKLRAAIDQGAFEVAADCYADAAPLLKKYGHKVGMLCWSIHIGSRLLQRELQGARRAALSFLSCAAPAGVSRCTPHCCCAPPRLQGAFKRVAADVEALGHELAGLLRKRLLAAPDQVCFGRNAQSRLGLRAAARLVHACTCCGCAAGRVGRDGLHLLPNRVLNKCGPATLCPAGS